MSTYWQIAAGEEAKGRDYSKLFLRFGMAFFGSGADRYEEIKVGDTVILKQGTTEILAAGKVVQREDGEHNGYCRGDSPDKEWLLDVEGWQLPAYCYIDWKTPELGGGAIPVTGLAQRAMCQVKKLAHQKKADDILATGYLPEETEYGGPQQERKEVKDEELLERLVREGLSTSSADELKNTVAKIRLLADYYYNHCNWGDILEHETRTFLVAPLLLALGWSEQQLKIELAGVDITCFSKPYKNWEKSRENCVAIIETKGFAYGLDYARNQAESYSKNFPNCKALITTNGYCYKIYLRNEVDGSFPEDPYDPSAYINLLKPRDQYPLNPKEGNGALDAINWLLPNNLIQTV